ncbi:tail fiber domain-containing protein [Trichocoleus sp. Lan]|uniref:tail fiber domain-containing protein n=1 Tax=Trichocoleus sp. Lan TaxID=2933927 RepID=UPI003298F7F4
MASDIKLLDENQILIEGNVGIGTPDPGYKLDVADRMRVRQANNTAGIWFYQSKPAKDQAFVGMASDTQVGFYGTTGAGWGLVMDTTTSNVGIGTGQANPVRRLHVEGSEIHSAGSGAGFSFSDRKVKSFVEKPSKGERWVWYSHNGTAHLWSGENKLSVSSDGEVDINGSLQVLVPKPSSSKASGTTGTGKVTFDEIINAGDISAGRKIPTGEIDADDVRKNFELAFVPAIVVSKTTGNVGIGVFSPSVNHQLDVLGNAQITGNLTATTVTNTSSKTLKDNITQLSAQEAMAALRDLNPVKFNFKADETKELHVGFIAEDVPELVAMADRKTLSSMDIVAVLTKVVQEQQQQILQLVSEVNTLKQAQAAQ